MEDKMENFYFSNTETNGESISLSFDIEKGPSIYKFHRMCKQFAAACGYTEKSIEEAFGETVYEED